MGVQITIEIDDLVAAGWQCKVVDDSNWEIDDDGNEIECNHQYLLISNGSWEFGSYVSDCFYADCNSWGSNISKFKEAGLFDIPHILG